MTWVRWGDTSANHPIVLSVLEHDECDDRLVNEVHGFVSRCSAQSGSHLTDYVISRGTAVLIAGPSRVDTLLDVAVFAGYMTGPHLLDDGRRVWKLVDDDHDFLHLRLREEVEFERQRRRDNSNPSLIVPVRLRDGDACRWCGRIVDWSSRKASRSGTYDHLVPGQAATLDTYVVCCQGCNSSRKDGSRPRTADSLYPAPQAPYYSDRTIKWLTDNEWRRRQNLPVPPRSRRKLRPGDLAPGLPVRDTVTPTPEKAPAGDRPATQAGSDHTKLDTDSQSARPVSPAQRTDTTSVNATSPRPDNQSGSGTPDPTEHTENSQGPAETQDLSEIRGYSADPAEHEGTESVRTGRVGTGRDGSGRVGNPPTQVTSLPEPSTRSSSRSRRRRRSRKTSRQHSTGDPHVH